MKIWCILLHRFSVWLTFFGDNKDFLFKMVFNLCGLICHRDSFIPRQRRQSNHAGVLRPLRRPRRGMGRTPGFRLQLPYLPALLLWTHSLNFLSLSFLVCKITPREFLPWQSGLRIWHCHSRGIGHKRSSDLVLLCCNWQLQL